MAVSFNSTGNRQTYFAKPADTNAATVYTVGTNVVSATLEAVNMAATGAAAATVWINDGSTDYLLTDALSVGANTTDTREFGNPVLRAGYSVKVKTSSANNLTFAVTIAEETRIT